MMPCDPLTRIRIGSLRSVERLALDLRPLTIFIGENGTGKSTIVEAFELLRKAAEPGFLTAFNLGHGGALALFRQGQVIASVGLETAEFTYLLVLERRGSATVISSESVWAHGRHALERSDASPDRVVTRSPDGSEGSMAIEPGETAISRTVALQPDHLLHRVRRTLQGIETFPAFEVASFWSVREKRGRAPLRETSPLFSTDRLARDGSNLAAAFHELKNGRGDWLEVLRRVRLGLPRVSDVQIRLDPGGQGGAIALKYEGLHEPVGVAHLSDGTLIWLAHVANTQLLRMRPASAVILDEPDLHLHPRLQAEVLSLYEDLTDRCPVVIATQSDALIDALPDEKKASSSVLCEVNEAGETVTLQPDDALLRRWLQSYRFSQLRYEGLEGSYFTQTPRAADGEG